MKMLSPYRIPSNGRKRRRKVSVTHKSQGGSMREIDEITDDNLDEILHIINI